MSITRVVTSVTGLAITVLVAGIGTSTSVGAQASASAPSGRSVFTTYCATCHGTSAKGDGPLATSLTKRPADLTMIAARNGGTFPAEQVARTIDGKSPVKGHGGGDMPVWGDAFSKSSADQTSAAEKISRLVDYLKSIQSKP